MAPSRMKTRGKGSSKSVPEPGISNEPKVTLAPQSSNPPKVFILPKDTSTDARIITLSNPFTSAETRYLCCPEKGFYEFTKIGAPRTTPRSWLLVPKDEAGCPQNAKPSAAKLEKDSLATGYATKAADMFIATPIDPLFLVLPVLAPPPLKSAEEKKRMFLAGDDYLDRLSSISPHFIPILRKDSIRTLLETRMEAVCDTVDAGDTMYRLSEEKLLKELLRKAKTMVAGGLPASMEEKLIRKALEVPMLSFKRGESSMHELADKESSGALTPMTESTDSQMTVRSTDTATSFASTAATSFSEPEDLPSKMAATPAPAPIIAPDGIPELLRLRTAFNYITSSYIPAHLTTALNIALSSPTSLFSFTALDAHISHLEKLRQEALASRSLGDFSRKRSLNEDEEAGESRQAKKLKKEEEEKKQKLGQSRGVRDLKKVNVSGMKKMSDFFKKK